MMAAASEPLEVLLWVAVVAFILAIAYAVAKRF